MISVSDVVDRVGPTLLRTVALPTEEGCVCDVVIAEPARQPQVGGDELVLGVGDGDADAA